jgi:hypothetical protein
MLRFNSIILPLFFAFWGFQSITAQTITSQNQRLWLGYITQSRMSESFSVWNDFHWVPDGFGVLRTGGSYHFNDKLNIITTGGYAYLWFHPPSSSGTGRPEHRPWGQTTASHRSNQFSFLHRVRYEARFRKNVIKEEFQNEFNFNFRLRYLLQMRYFFPNQTQTGKWFAMASDEILFNAGKEISSGFRMDQNRISLGIGFQYKNFTVQVAYMNQLIEAPNDFTFTMNHNLQILMFHNFDFRKKEVPLVLE